MHRRILFIGTAMSFCSSLTIANEVTDQSEVTTIDDVIITASARDEQLRSSTATVQVIDQKQIERSDAISVTELLAQNAAGFFSEWTPGQTSFNIRGAATDGQGKDFKSQVLVLINGRRAGTANLSKLSPNDVYRIEIVRGPASVIYGSQAIGGVVNIILKDGHNTSGGKLSLSTGSAKLMQGHGEYGWESEDGRFSGYLGLTASSQNDYRSGKNGRKMFNTGWERYGATGALGWQIDDNNQVDMMIRTDGIYNVGFRGSSANHYAKEDRYNQSADLIWNHGQEEDRVRWKLHGYLVEDVDDFKWASPKTAKTSLDHNKRKLSIGGFKFQPIVTPFEGNELLLGIDAEKSKLRSNRHRVGLNGAAMTQVSPFDNNQTEKVYGLYFDDSQRLIDDRLILRAGARYTHGKTYYDETPNLQNQLTGSATYDSTTWNVGANFEVNNWLNFKTSVATGFRAPTSSELGADYTTLAGSQIYGNRNLSPESNLQYEAGAVLTGNSWFMDIALFENKIKNTIVTKPRSSNSSISDYINNPDDIVIRGLEINSRFALDELFDWNGNWNWSVLANGSWNFYMKDKGVGNTRNTDKPQRIYQYQASLTNRIGQSSAAYPWSIQLSGILNGPIWYDTEENLIAGAEPYKNYIHRKSLYWVWNLRGEVDVSKRFSLFAEVDNLFNKNQHPLFIALDKEPYLLDPSKSNGGLGTSMQGRAFYVGGTYRF